MINIALASNAAIPDPAKYADPNFVPNVKPAAPVIDLVALARKFDGRMHGRMNAAQNPGDWMDLRAILINAHGNKNLRINVRDRFFKDCPYENIVVGFKMGIDYSDPLPKQMKVNDEVEQTAANERFDGRMRFLMKQAGDDGKKWKDLQEILLRAHANGNLRVAIRDRFLTRCPCDNLLNHLRKETKSLDSAESSKKLSRAALAQKRADNRAARHALQPAKGRAGQTTEVKGKKNKKK